MRGGDERLIGATYSWVALSSARPRGVRPLFARWREERRINGWSGAVNRRRRISSEGYSGTGVAMACAVNGFVCVLFHGLSIVKGEVKGLCSQIRWFEAASPTVRMGGSWIASIHVACFNAVLNVLACRSAHVASDFGWESSRRRSPSAGILRFREISPT